MSIISIFDTEIVTVLCSCKRFLPLCRTFFCRYCFEVRCYNCITHEVDGYFCPTCLENMASGEANLRRDKCSNCFDCPSCGNMLSIRASVIQIPKIDDPSKVELQKMYYMACNFCRWTTRDSGIADKKTSNNACSQTENPHTPRIKELINKFNEYASKEKLEKERTKFASRKNYFFLLDSSNSGRRRYSSHMRMNKRQSEVEKSPINITTQEPKEEIDGLDESIFEKKLVLEEVTNIHQRLRDPERQPQSVKDLYPITKQILIKRSMRCRKCDHNLCKPEIATNSTRFKINLGCVFHIPELKIKPFTEPLQFGKPQKIVITVQNPSHRLTKIRFGPITEYVDSISTGKLDLPTNEFQISAKNEIMALDEMDVSTTEFKDDDSKVVADRKLNKLSLFAQLTPMKSSGPILSCFKLFFEYKDLTLHLTSPNTTSTTVGDLNESGSDDSCWKSVVYKMDFGSISSVTASGDDNAK